MAAPEITPSFDPKAYRLNDEQAALCAKAGMLIRHDQQFHFVNNGYADFEAFLGALAPVAQRVHDGYDSARDGAGKMLDRVHGGHAGSSISDQIGRIGNNLKFW